MRVKVKALVEMEGMFKDTLVDALSMLDLETVRHVTPHGDFEIIPTEGGTEEDRGDD